MNTRFTHIEVNEVANGLQHAATVTLRLAEEGVTVLAAFSNGRRPALIVDRSPPGVVSAVKRSHPNGFGGRTVVRCAEYHGCQLEWLHDEPGVPHAQKPELRVVSNG